MPLTAISFTAQAALILSSFYHLLVISHAVMVPKYTLRSLLLEFISALKFRRASSLMLPLVISVDFRASNYAVSN
jgi:hypothetical protein